MQECHEFEGLAVRLRRCRELAQHFQTGPTAEMIRDLEEEILAQMRAIRGLHAERNLNHSLLVGRRMRGGVRSRGSSCFSLSFVLQKKSPRLGGFLSFCGAGPNVPRADRSA